jgi:septal ring factor EnvC (AmiA/AmiB activator)
MLHVKNMSAYTTNQISLIGIILVVCVVVVSVFAYNQISILGRNVNALETDKNSLENQVAALTADKASLENRVDTLENQVAALTADKASLENQLDELIYRLSQHMSPEEFLLFMNYMDMRSRIQRYYPIPE